MFIPGSIRPAELDARMRRSLADSLSYLHDVTGADLGIAKPDAAAAVGGIAKHRVGPGVFGRYYKLVPAIERGDMAEAARLFQAIIELAREDVAQGEQAFAVAPFSDAALGADKALYGELIEADPEGPHWLGPPRDDLWAGFDQKVHRALQIIERADPPLAAELRGLVVQVVGASPVEGRAFGGASSLMLWGLVLLNVETYGEVPALVEGLVHEAAHQLLFAYSIDEPLVTNALAERYPSPLRPDDRPMDGIFHATFVTARLHYVCRKLRDAATAAFCPVPIEVLDAKLSSYRDLYFDGLGTIETYGKLTSTGRHVLDQSLQYMRAT